MEAIRIKAKKELARIMDLPINKETLLTVLIFKAKRLTLQYHKNTLLGSWDNCTAVFFLSTGVQHPLFLLSLKRRIFL